MSEYAALSAFRPHPRGLAFVLAFLVASLPPAPFADEAAWERHLLAGEAAYHRGDHAEAVRQTEAALRAARPFGEDDPRFATTLSNLGALHGAQGRYAEAESLYRRSLAIREKVLGADHPQVATSLNNLGMLYHAQGRYGQAAPLLERSLEISEEKLGPMHPDVATSLNNLGALHQALSRYAEAEPLYERSLAIREKVLGPAHPHVGSSLVNLAELYRGQGRYAEAESSLERAIAILEAALGPEHPDVATSLNNLAGLLHARGRSAEAEALYGRSLAIREKALGAEHLVVASNLSNLANLYREQGRYAEAEPLLQRSLAIAEQALGPGHPDLAASLNNLALLYEAQGGYAAAEPLYERSLEIVERALGSAHPQVAENLNNLAGLYESHGRYADAEPLLRRSLEIFERTLGPTHPGVASSLHDLAGLYVNQGRYADAEPLYERAIALREDLLGARHPDLAVSLRRLADLYRDQGRYAEAEPLLRRSVAISEATFGAAHPAIAASLNSLGLLHHAQGHYDEAGAVFERSLAIREKVLGAAHVDVATSLNNLAGLYHLQSRHAEAEPLLRRAVAITERTLGPGHPDVAPRLHNLASLYYAEGRYEEALELSRRVTSLSRRHARPRASIAAARVELGPERAHPMIARHLASLHRLSGRTPAKRLALAAEGFEVAQLAARASAGQALERMAARFAAGDDALARIVRSQQDALERWKRLDARLVKAIGEPPEKRDAASEARLGEELTATERELEALDRTLEERFPEYRELVSSSPLGLAEAQSLVGPDEALLSYLVDEDATHLWVLRRRAVEMYLLPLGRVALAEAVREIRAGLAPGAIETLEDIPAFPAEAAHALHLAILAPALAMLKDARHLMIVPDGALESLPFGVLVTEEVAGPSDTRALAFLVERYALTTLPSVGSLRSLRRFAKGSRAAQPFIGFGDPELGGGASDGRGIDVAKLVAARGTVDVNELRRLPRLPETALELRAVAAALRAPPSAVHLRVAATESRVKGTDLSSYRVLMFATHGLMAGELAALAEPGLVLTPPNAGTTHDDGLLTASEAAMLALNADWVILSACNTAAPDGTPGAEGLSGLARSFFYAGARALLVSHWPVSSEAAVALTTKLFDELAASPAIGGSEALRRAMLEVMNDETQPHFAHPMFWAPFVVVGEGGSPSTGL